MDLQDVSLGKLKDIIISHKEELINKKGNTRMLDIAKAISESIQHDKRIEDHFQNLLQKIASKTSDFALADYSSLASFVEHSNLIGRETCFEYLGLVKGESDITKKTLLMKIANIMDEGYIPVRMIIKDGKIKAKYPLFWLDMLFKNNQRFAISKLKEITLSMNFTFTEIFPVIDRWLFSMQTEKEALDFYKKNIIELENHFTDRDLILYQKWLEKRKLRPQIVLEIKKYQNDLEPVIKI